jgi:hypothetical protein
MKTSRRHDHHRAQQSIGRDTHRRSTVLPAGYRLGRRSKLQRRIGTGRTGLLAQESNLWRQETLSFADDRPRDRAVRSGRIWDVWL